MTEYSPSNLTIINKALVYFRKTLCVVFGLTTLSSFGQKKVSQRESFKSPDAQYNSMPFWHLKGELTNEGIEQKMKDAKSKANFSRVAVLPVSKMKPDFLGEAYFEKYDHILKAAKKLDMHVIMYNDSVFSSGNADGGILETKFPQDLRKRIEKKEFTEEVPMEVFYLKKI